MVTDKVTLIDLRSNKYDVSGVQKGIRGITDIVCPSSEHAKETVADIVSTISAVINCQIDPDIDHKTAMYEVNSIISEHVQIPKRRKNNSGGVVEEYSIDRFSPWIWPTKGKYSISETNGFRHFVYFVCHCISRFVHENCSPKRLVMPLRPLNQLLDNTSSDDDNSYDYTYRYGEDPVNIALVSMDPNGNWRECVGVASDKKLSKSMIPPVDDIVGNVELEANDEEINEMYLKHCSVVSGIAGLQVNRRLTWGLMVLESIVHINVFGPGIALASEDLDLATEFGRQEFIRLLVNWAYCDRERLGFDPSLSFCDDIDCWEIPFNTSSDGQKTFYGYLVHSGQTDAFGLYPACISAKVSKPLMSSWDCVPEEGDVTIKDYWPILPGEGDMDPCDEIRHLQCINGKLASNEEFYGMYPVLLGYEDVKINGQLDTNREFLGENIWRQLDDKTVVRVHKRVMIKGVYKPLSMSSCSAPEMIVVFNDVMRVYTEISRSCHILHRKINCSSIWVRRDERGIARGVLGDFSEAINVQETPRIENDFVHQTPYLSIARQQGLERPPEELDDWESLFYTVCLVGTYGTTDSGSEMTRDDKKRNIYQWYDDRSSEIVWCKRSVLDSVHGFCVNIAREFNKEIDSIKLLQNLALNLELLIFFNKKVKGKERGYICGACVKPEWEMPRDVLNCDDFDDPRYTEGPDPLMHRTNPEDINDIRQNLLDFMDMYAKVAWEMLGKNN